MNNLGGEDSDTIVENGAIIVWGRMVFSSTVPVRRKTCR